MGHKPKKEIVCLCNQVPRDVIEQAIVKGANTPGKIFDATTAGVGACGGSCRVKLYQMLDSYTETKTFPEKLSMKYKQKKK